MIFDNDTITELVKYWQLTKDKGVLSDIVEGTRPLIESIVSCFDRNFRDDLIQEAITQIVHSVQFFDEDISKLYSYFCAVIRNACISFLRVYTREIAVEEICQPVHFVDYSDDLSILTELRVRNRCRFPSLSVETVDGASEDVYKAIKNGIARKSYGAIALLMKEYDLTRRVATIFYHSSVVYLRVLFEGKFSKVSKKADFEFTMLPELESIVGTVIFERIKKLFSGMYIKVP